VSDSVKREFIAILDHLNAVPAASVTRWNLQMQLTEPRVESAARACDRRRFRRSQAGVIAIGAPKELWRILNISRRGIGIASRQALQIGGLYLFELHQNGQGLLVEGEVKWLRQGLAPEDRSSGRPPEFQAGLAFLNARPKHPQIYTRPPESTLEVAALAEPDDLSEIRTRLLTASQVDDIGEALLDLLAQRFERIVLFRYQDDHVRAWMGRGPKLEPKRLAEFRLSLESPSLFLDLQRAGGPHLGKVPNSPSNLELLRCWDGDPKHECALVPIRVNSHLACVLYVDCNDSTALTSQALDLLSDGAELLTEAFGRAILRRKGRDSTAALRAVAR
jgi:hypothetical protein